MRTKTLIILGMLALLLISGCNSGTNYAIPTQVQNPNNNQYVGGGCGVSGIDDYGDIKELPMWGDL